MNLLLVTPYYPPHWGGLEVVSYHVANGMRLRGHEVNVLTTALYSGSAPLEDRVNVYRLPISFKIFNTPVSLNAYTTARKLAKRANLIHAYAYPVYLSDISARVATERRIPFVLEWVIDPRQAPAYKKNIIAKLITNAYFKIHGNKVFRKAACIIVPSKWHKRYLSGHNVPEEKIHVIPCGIDAKLFNPGVPSLVKNDSAPMILYVGRINEQKGLDILLRAFQLILKEHPDTLLIIIGSCDQAGYWKRLQKYLIMLKDRVKFLGNVSSSQLVHYYRSSRLVVFPSRYESFGMVVIEAMGCGTPVVGTSVGAVTDLIKKAGILVKQEDPQGLADAINQLLSDSDLRKRLGEKAVELFSRQHSWKKILDRYESIYRKCLMMT